MVVDDSNAEGEAIPDMDTEMSGPNTEVGRFSLDLNALTDLIQRVTKMSVNDGLSMGKGAVGTAQGSGDAAKSLRFNKKEVKGLPARAKGAAGSVRFPSFVFSSFDLSCNYRLHQPLLDLCHLPATIVSRRGMRSPPVRRYELQSLGYLISTIYQLSFVG